MAVAVGLVALLTSPVLAQPFGGFGGFGRNDPLALLYNKQVQKELNLKEDQLAKLPDAVEKALSEVLDKDQLKRLHQIQLQLRGPQAFADPKVQQALKFTDKQKDEVKTILSDAKKEIDSLEKGPTMFKEMQNINKAAAEKATGVLTDTQKKAWKDMQGEKFEIKFGKPGGGADKTSANAVLQPVIRVVVPVVVQKKD
jgi:hypothetical protein